MNQVYSIETLEESVRGEKPAKFAVLGYPVSHSASPELHQPALDAANAGCSYVRLEVEPGRLREAFDKMKALGFSGCNVTVPYKFEALGICDEVSDEARVLGAVNTVSFTENGSRGFNTDGPGIVQAVRDAFGLDPANVHTLILGAGGGAGQAIATQFALAKPEQLTLVNRSLDKIVALARRLERISPETDIFTLDFDDPGFEGACHDADLIIQTTSLGLKPTDPPVIPDSCFLSSHCVYDTIYQPPETPFLASARRMGCKTDNGLSLLVHQGAIAFRHWFPETDPLPEMRRAMGLS